LPKKLTKAAKQNFEIREAFKGLCELILDDVLTVRFVMPTDDPWEAFEENAKLSNAMLLYRKLYPVDTALIKQDREARQGNEGES
jgi:hypothetical protein